MRSAINKNKPSNQDEQQNQATITTNINCIQIFMSNIYKNDEVKIA